MRTGLDEKSPTTHKLIPQLQIIAPGRIAALMIHGRSKQQRYSKLANWDYILTCAQSQNLAKPAIPIIGNGDIFSFADWHHHMHMLAEPMAKYTDQVTTGQVETKADYDPEVLGLCSCAMLGRGALVKPWLPLELKEQRLFDISASQRLDMLKNFW